MAKVDRFGTDECCEWHFRAIRINRDHEGFQNIYEWRYV